MSRTVTIDPVTRIEGHSLVTIQLDDDGEVSDARFHVTQFRGFERISQGRPVHEMPSLMARICGICPVSHLVASSKAVDAVMATTPPPTGADLRRLINLAQVVQSNALSFFHLSAPDLLFGFDAPPERRNVFAMAAEGSPLAFDGIALRRFGQHTIELLGGKRIHPSWVVPGGVEAPLGQAARAEILAGLPEAVAATERALDWYAAHLAGWAAESAVFGEFPSAFLALVGADGEVEHYDGRLRCVDADGSLLGDLDPTDYARHLGEEVEDDSFLKSVYWKDRGYPEGIYRVGPLARLNVAERTGTPRADARLAAYRDRVGRIATSSFHYHEARLIDTLHSLEAMQRLLLDDDICSPRVRSHAGINRHEGIGVAEAPRGTLIHHYRVDDDGLVQWANLVIATGHNSMAMNASVAQVARHFVRGEDIAEGMLNRVEAVIRCYDPCLSCSTHAVGQMALRVQLRAPDGRLLDEVAR